VSVANKGVQGNADSGTYAPSISPDGRYVAFDSLAWNLVPGDITGTKDMFVRDRCPEPDADGDCFPNPQQTRHVGPTNDDGAFDNCPITANPTQQNSDGNYVDNSPPYSPAIDDRTWPMSDALGDACDLDADNDGIPDADELSGASCGSIITDPLLRDSDGDDVLDGAECTLGFDPTSNASEPTLAQCGTPGDADGDKIQDRLELCYYNTSNASTDTDSDRTTDGAKDGCEVASLNGDRVVSSGDQGMLASGITGAFLYHANVDINKDGLLNSGDQGLMASFISPPGQCPG
jgi:hypothetical protein